MRYIRLITQQILKRVAPLIEPLAVIPNREHYREAQLLAILNLMVIVTALVGFATLVWNYTPEQQVALLPVWFGLALFFVPYHQARLGRIRVAAYIMTYIALFLVVWSSLVTDATLGKNTLYYLILINIFSATRFSLRASAGFLLMTLSCTFLFCLIHPEVPLIEILGGPFSYNVLAGGFALLFIHFARLRESEKSRLLLISETERLKLLVEQREYGLLKDFVNAVSHDFRTHLSILETNRYILLRSISSMPDSEKSAVRLRNITNAIQVMTDRLEDLNLITELRKLQLTPVSLATLIQTALDDQKALMERRRLRLEWSVPADDTPIMCDSHFIALALKHVINNACTYTPDDGLISVRLFFDTAFAYIVVKDTGIGISSEHLSNIFAPFYKVNEARTTTEAGLGVGLTIARLIIATHEGTIAVDSEPDKGTVVTITLSKTLTPSPTTVPKSLAMYL